MRMTNHMLPSSEPVESVAVEDDERNAKSAEYEIHKIKEDFMIGKAAAISYKTLIRITQEANIQDALPILKQSFEEVEPMSDWITDNASDMIDRLWPKNE